MTGPSGEGRDREAAAGADRDTVATLRLQQGAYQAALVSNGHVVQASMREFLR